MEQTIGAVVASITLAGIGSSVVVGAGTGAGTVAGAGAGAGDRTGYPYWGAARLTPIQTVSPM